MVKKVLLIIPCFNEEKNIVQLLADIRNISIPGYELHPLPVNDHSSDNTLLKIKSNSELYLNLANNLGIGGAVQAGLKFAYQNKFDIAVQMDGDGQHPPAELYKLLGRKCDLCIGSRYLNKSEGFQSTRLRRFGINALNRLIYLTTGRRIYDCTSGYRVYHKKAIDLFIKYYPDKYPEPESIVYALLKGLNLEEVSVEMKERTGGVTSISGFSTLYYMIKVALAILFIRLSTPTSRK